MMKSTLMQQIADLPKMAEIPEHKIAKAVNCIIENLSQALAQGRRIEIRDFGSFDVRIHQARNARNPRTGEKMVTQPKKSPHFKPGKDLRDRVNASRTKHPIMD